MKRLFLLVIILISCLELKCQELNAEITPHTTIDLSPDKLLLDLNGDTCLVLILFAEIEGIRYNTNRGIENIQHDSDSTVLWVPKGSSVLKISAPGYPLLECKIPISGNAYNSFNITINKVGARSMYVGDTIERKLEIISRPKKAQVYINGVYQGITPATVSIPDSMFSLELIRKRYFEYDSLINITDDKNSIETRLERNHDAGILYLGPSLMYDRAFMYGITIGSLKKVGIYGAARFGLSFGNPTIQSNINTYDNPSEYISLPLTSEAMQYYYTTPEKAKLSYNRIQLTSGVNLRIGKSVFFSAGAGLSKAIALLEVDRYEKTTEFLEDLSANGIDEIKDNYQVYKSHAIYTDNSHRLVPCVDLGFGFAGEEQLYFQILTTTSLTFNQYLHGYVTDPYRYMYLGEHDPKFFFSVSFNFGIYLN